jgi:hypothetical protein
MAKKTYPPPPPGYHIEFVAWITNPKTGERIYAKTFGKRAFPILVAD